MTAVQPDHRITQREKVIVHCPAASSALSVHDELPQCTEPRAGLLELPSSRPPWGDDTFPLGWTSSTS